MNKNLVINSNANNHYLVSRSIPQILLIHPILNYLIQLEEKGTDLREWINNLKDKKIAINETTTATKKELHYYFKYYLFLLQINYFKKPKRYPLDVNRYTKERIENHLTNVAQILFEVTDSCNMECKYCGYGDFYRDYDERKGKNLSIQTAKNLLDYIKEVREKKLNINHFKYNYIGFYGGEPLLNFPFVEEIVEYSKIRKKPGSGLKFSITTNGVLLDRYMDFLVENDFDIGISLDGDQECNDFRMLKNGKPSFPLVFKNAEKLKDKYPDFFKKNVSFFTVFHKKSSLKKIDKFFGENFNKYPMITGLSTVGVNQERAKEFVEMHRRILEDLEPGDIDTTDLFRHPWRVHLNDFIFANSFYIIKKYSQLRSELEEVIRVQTDTCNPLENKVFLTVNGKILPCERIPHLYYLGKVDDTGVKIDFQEIAYKYNRWYEKMSKLCNVCDNSQKCDQCILQLDLEAVNCNCRKFVSATSHRKKLEESISMLEDAPLLYSSILKGKRKGEENIGKRDTRKYTKKSYWLYLNPYVHLKIKKDFAVLYNSRNGTLLEYQGNSKVMQILRKLDNDKNLYVVRLKEAEITYRIDKFISDIRDSYSGDIIDAAWSTKKPVQFKPILHLQETVRRLTFKPKVKLLQKDDIEEYLEVVDLYINNECGQNCTICNGAHKQFLYCTAHGVKKSELDLAAINRLLVEVEISPIYQLNILGGNLLKHSQLLQLTGSLNNLPAKKDYYIHYLNFEENMKWLELLGQNKLNTIQILINIPVKKNILSKVLDILECFSVNRRFHFVLEKEEDMAPIEELTSEYSLEDIFFHPYFNGNNQHFFEENVFIDKESVIESRPTMKKIFTNTVVNSLNFRRLTVMSNKDVFANLNHRKIGKLGTDSVFNIIRKELSKGRSWGRIRKNVAPCRSCVYNTLCPPISNYEYTFGKYNLCTIY